MLGPRAKGLGECVARRLSSCPLASRTGPAAPVTVVHRARFTSNCCEALRNDAHCLFRRWRAVTARGCRTQRGGWATPESCFASSSPPSLLTQRVVRAGWVPARDQGPRSSHASCARGVPLAAALDASCSSHRAPNSGLASSSLQRRHLFEDCYYWSSLARRRRGADDEA